MGVTEVTQPIRLYLDEMIPVGLAVVLRQYGYDVLAAKEANMFGKNDKEQLDFALSNRRAIITFNQRIPRSSASGFQYIYLYIVIPAKAGIQKKEILDSASSVE
jgi:uncharacterized protein with PIN domain